ncbi:MAG: radical SAM protein [Candidatus Aenigmatarchaeota archaeon]
MLPSLKLFYRILKTNFGIFNPFELNFAVTYLCNSRCKTCNIWKIKSKNELSLEEIKNFAKKIKFIHWLRLTGGEPFLRKDYVEIVKTLDEELDLYLLTTPTNGLIPNLIEEKIERILKFFKGNYIITVSLDGPKEIHEFIRGIEGSWEKAMNTFEKLKKFEKNYKNFKVFFGYTISPFNVNKFDETVNEVQKVFPYISYNDFHVNIFHLSTFYYHTTYEDVNNLNLKEFNKTAITEIKKILSHKKVEDFISLINKKYLLYGIKYLENKKTPVDCNIYNLSTFVDPYGNVYPCSIFNFKLGNLRENNYNLLKILNSKRAKKAKELIKNKKCPSCWTPCEAHQMILSRLLHI